jgi:hypothetical protein
MDKDETGDISLFSGDSIALSSRVRACAKYCRWKNELLTRAPGRQAADAIPPVWQTWGEASLFPSLPQFSKLLEANIIQGLLCKLCNAGRQYNGTIDFRSMDNPCPAFIPEQQPVTWDKLARLNRSYIHFTLQCEIETREREVSNASLLTCALTQRTQGV